MTPCRPALLAILVLAACHDAPAPSKRAPVVEPAPLARTALSHRTPYIPPQCYARTRDDGGRVHNSCYTCHVTTPAPNHVADVALQASYDFGPRARINPWRNLFVDRRAAVSAMSNDAILVYVREDNYAPLLPRLAAPPADWDSDGDHRWTGWLPDLAFRFDDGGFDRTRDGGYTGWRAYAYYALPGAFWPTNGSFGDVMIRLPAAFREDDRGLFHRGVYEANLAILEALIARRDVAIDPIDERVVGVDLDGDGRMGVARRVRERWQPGPDGGGMRWAGRAGQLQDRGEVHLMAGLFPEGTELAHSLRYLDVHGDRARMAARMKELRYMVKTAWLDDDALVRQAAIEADEKARDPYKTRTIVGSAEGGIDNRAGWQLQAFIEDARGALRPQSLEEHAYCIGCHSGVGATDDSVFSFGRKLPADRFQRGWYHPGQRGLEGVPEPVRADGRGEYALYLEQNGAGDDLRTNTEVLSRFFDEHGELRPEMRARLRDDVSPLLIPGAARALDLDKAYRAIVLEQSFLRGRDATIEPAALAHRELPEQPLATGVVERIADRRSGVAFLYPGLARPATSTRPGKPAPSRP